MFTLHTAIIIADITEVTAIIAITAVTEMAGTGAGMVKASATDK
jgi:hypothetical protein